MTIELVDASHNTWGDGYGASSAQQFSLITARDPVTGQPQANASGVIDPLHLRLHKLPNPYGVGVDDWRWSPQLVVDPLVDSEPQSEMESPYQHDGWSSANRSTRIRDARGRSTVASSAWRVVGGLDGRFGLALNLGNAPELRILSSEGAGFGEGLGVTEYLDAARRRSGFGERASLADSISASDSVGTIQVVGGEVYDPLELTERVRQTFDPDDQVLTRGALGRDVRRSTAMQLGDARAGTRTRQQGEEGVWGVFESYAEDRYASKAVGGGLVYTPADGGRAGTLQSVFSPELAAGVYGIGPDEVPIGPAVIRATAQIGYPASPGTHPLVGPVAFRPVDATWVRGGTPFTGVMGFRPGPVGPAGLAVNGRGEWAPVVYVTADVAPADAPQPAGGGGGGGGGGGQPPPGGNPPPFAPPPGGGGQPPPPGGGGGGQPPPGGGGGGGGDGSGGGKKKPKPPKPMPYEGPLDGTIRNPFTGQPIGWLPPLVSNPFTGEVYDTPGYSLGSFVQVADLQPESAGARQENSETGPGPSSGNAHAPTLWDPDPAKALEAKFGFAPLGMAEKDPPMRSGCGPNVDAIATPAMQETWGSQAGGVVSPGWATVGRNGGTLQVSGPDYSLEVQAAGGEDYALGQHNVLTAPGAFFGAEGSPATVEGHLRYQDLRLEAVNEILRGAFGGERSYAGSLSVVSRNGPASPPSRNLIGHHYTSGGFGSPALRPDGTSALEVRSVLEAQDEGTVQASYGAVASVVREHRGLGVIRDWRPLLYLDNDRGARGRVGAYMIATPQGEFGVTSAGGVETSSVEVATQGNKPHALSVGYKHSLGGIKGLPQWSVGSDGVVDFAQVDETPDTPESGRYRLYADSTSVYLLDDSGTSTDLAATGTETGTTTGSTGSATHTEEVTDTGTTRNAPSGIYFASEIVSEGSVDPLVTSQLAPTGSKLRHVWTEILSDLNGGTGDSISVGTPSDNDRWGTTAADAYVAGTKTSSKDYTGDPEYWVTGAGSTDGKIRIYSNGFTTTVGSGEVLVIVAYSWSEDLTS